MKTKTNFTLPNKKVRVKPNYKNSGWVKNPKHAAYFKLEGTFDKLMVPQLRNGQLANVLTDEEKEYLESVMLMEENDLSIYKKKDNFWHSFSVSLGKEPLILDLSDPNDYIKYKVLLANSYVVAPDVKSINNGGKYKYYIEDEEEVTRIQSQKANIYKQAWMGYAKIEDSKEKLRTFLIVFNETFTPVTKKLDRSSKLDFLQKEVSQIVENRTNDFVDIITDKNYDTKALIAEGVQTGVIEKKGSKYYLTGGVDKIGDDFVGAIEFLNSPQNQETRLLIEERIKAQI